MGGQDEESIFQIVNLCLMCGDFTSDCIAAKIEGIHIFRIQRLNKIDTRKWIDPYLAVMGHSHERTAMRACYLITNDSNRHTS